MNLFWIKGFFLLVTVFCYVSAQVRSFITTWWNRKMTVVLQLPSIFIFSTSVAFVSGPSLYNKQVMSQDVAVLWHTGRILSWMFFSKAVSLETMGQNSVEFWKAFRLSASVWCSATFGSAGLEVQFLWPILLGRHTSLQQTPSNGIWQVRVDRPDLKIPKAGVKTSHWCQCWLCFHHLMLCILKFGAASGCLYSLEHSL